VNATVALTALLALAWPAPPVPPGPERMPRPRAERPEPEFRFTDSTGRTVTKADLAGKVWLASFVVTRCPDGKCPQVTQTMQRLQKELAGVPNLLLVTFTVDPKDGPDELDRYAKAHDADSKRWLFLTGSEEEIHALLQSFHLRAPDSAPGGIEHAQKLVLIDHTGKVRGYYDGLESPYAPEGDFERDLTALKKNVHRLAAEVRPAWMPVPFPAFNATLNGVAAILICAGWLAIRAGYRRLHVICMVAALLVSALFLTSYLYYHLAIKAGAATRFRDLAPEAPDGAAYLYGAILLSHTILAVCATPMALVSAYLGARDRLRGHVRLAKWTLPIWLYVSVTGVVVYWMLYRLYAP
jgi:protein SCO1/2/putative membrane protein